MKHVDLFSGIGGFSLACEWAGIETILFCENDKFCQKVLNKHWPNVPIVEDVNDKEEIKRIVADAQNLLGYGGNDNTGISTQQETLSESGNGDRQGITPDTGRFGHAQRKEQAAGIIERDEITTDAFNEGLQGGQTTYGRGKCEYGNRHEVRNKTKPDLMLTAGFPCQPFSGAGKRKGSADDRYLWPQTLAVIESIKPDAVILENVAGLLSMVFPNNETNVANQTSLFGNQDEEIAEYNTICGRIDSDLKQAGYETVWLVIPACSVGAPHRRDRVWIVANAKNSKCKLSGRTRARRQGFTDNYRTVTNSELCGCLHGQSNINSTERINKTQRDITTGIESPVLPVTDSDNTQTARQRENSRGIHGEPEPAGLNNSDRIIPDWRENWYEIAAEFCRVDARISNRVDRLKSLGNAIVPQVAYQIIKAITEVE